MELRSGQFVGASAGAAAQPQQQAAVPVGQARAAFEEGVRLLFRRWTALNLAVANQWGGPTSADKANWLLQESINWFYRNKEHYWDDLEEELDDALLQDFNVEAEDGSPAEVAKAMVALYQECGRGDFSTVLQLRAKAAGPSGAAQSQRQAKQPNANAMEDGDEDEDDSSSSGGEEDDDGPADAMMEDDNGQAPQAVVLQQQQPQQPQQPQRQGPVVDADGFELVQPRGRAGRRG